MDKRYRILLILLLSLSIVLGCGQVTSPQSAEVPHPTATLQPTATPILVWKKFESGGVELWLPESYVGGNLDEDIEFIAEKLKSLGPDFEQMAQIIEQNPSSYIIFAVDSRVGDSGFLTNMNITKEKVLSAINLDIYLEAMSKQLPAPFQVIERDIISLGNYQAGRLVVEFTINGRDGKSLMYVIQDGNTMWCIAFGTGAEEFDQRLPTFEQSALTFAIQP